MIKINFNQGWYFGKDAGGMFCAAEEQVPVTLPHDAMILEERSADNPSGNAGGFFPGGNYLYSKTFHIPDTYKGSRVMLRFEGVYGQCTVYVNGGFICSNIYGYTEFYADMTSHLKYGAENLIQVKVLNADQPNSRWYSGSGIYRPVTLLVGGPVHIAEESVHITVKEAEEEVSALEIKIPLRYMGNTEKSVRIQTKIYEKDQSEVAGYEETPITLYPGDEFTVHQMIYLRQAKLWSPETPDLYSCTVRVLDGENGENDADKGEGGKVVLDECSEIFGIRHIQADPVYGLRINGKKIRLRGACIHHDYGILGAAEYEHSAMRRISQLKDAGFNAIRMSHHPASRAILNACDQYGVLVMDETYDAWTQSKQPFDHARYFENSWEREIQSVVAKDYNHPSAIFYSIGNEIQEAGTKSGARINRMLVDRFRTLDPTRLVTNAVNGLLTVMGDMGTILKDLNLIPPAGEQKEQGDVNDLMTAAMGNAGKMVAHPLLGEKLEETFSQLDVCGYNYMTSRYAEDSDKYPNRLIVGTETYMPQIAENWSYVKENLAILGDFTWTGYDYLGEAGIGVPGYNGPGGFFTPFPCYLANVGDLDILGYRRPASYYREIVWGLRKAPYLAVQPPEHYADECSLTPWIMEEREACWTWPGYEGKPCKVEVYSDAEEVELFLNGVSLGRQAAGEEPGYRTIFDVAYEPGVLEAVAYKNGVPVGQCRLSTVEGELHLEVEADKEVLSAGEADLSYITVSFRDRNGALAYNMREPVSITVTGNGTLMGFGSADPLSTENFFDKKRTSYRGMVQAAVRSGAEPGKIRICAEAEGYGRAELELEVK
ncbi:MAG TPA: DUF4982 domain-containing protein [Candidatus Mediterraneibacter intestinavium]|nr:DUF4982 domain-containing protein [Candidatus Mediterraneibacter intestinavium]